MNCLLKKEIASIVGEARAKQVMTLMTTPRPLGEAPIDGTQITLFVRNSSGQVMRTLARYRGGWWRVGATKESEYGVSDVSRIVGWAPLPPHPSEIGEAQ